MRSLRWRSCSCWSRSPSGKYRWESVRRPAGSDICSGGVDGLGDLRVQQLQASVGTRGRLLHQGQSSNESARQRDAADGEILNGTLCLRAPQSVSRDLQLAMLSRSILKEFVMKALREPIALSCKS